MATKRTKEQRLESLNARHARLWEKQREAARQRDEATFNYRACKEANLLADKGFSPINYNPHGVSQNLAISLQANEKCDRLARKMSEIRQRIEDINNGIA